MVYLHSYSSNFQKRSTELQRLLSGEMFHFASFTFSKSSSFGCKFPLFRINSVWEIQQLTYNFEKLRIGLSGWKKRSLFTLRESLKSIKYWNSNFLWFQRQRPEVKHLWSQKNNGHYDKFCIYVKTFLIIRIFCHKYTNHKWTCFFSAVGFIETYPWFLLVQQ